MPVTPAQMRRIGGVVGTEVTRPDRITTFLPMLLGVQVERQSDPILTTSGLPRYPDQREYSDLMMSDPLVHDPIIHLRSHVEQQPLEVKMGPSKSPAAELLHEYAEWVIRRLRRQVPKLVASALDGWWYGWRPHQVLVTEATAPNGQRVWAPARVVPKATHLMRWSVAKPDGSRDLLWSPTLYPIAGLMGGPLSAGAGPIRFDPVAQLVGWVHSRSGTTDSPYGGPSALTAPWLLWKLGSTYRSRMGKAVDRQFGTPKVQLESLGRRPHGDATLADQMDEVREDIESIMEAWNSLNVIVSGPGISAEIEAGLDLVTSGKTLLEWVQNGLRTAISGSVLTAVAGPSGSLALGIVQSDTEIGVARMAVRHSVEPMFCELLENSIRVNLVDDPDPDDLPYVESRLHLDITMEQLRTWVDLGARVDADRAAELMGHSEILAESEQVLERQAPSLLPSIPPFPAPDDDGGGDDDLSRGLVALGRITRQHHPVPGARRLALGDDETEGERRRIVAASDPEPVASWADQQIARHLEISPDPLPDLRLR